MDPATLEKRLARVHLVVFDVDGTLTDGAVVYGGAEELQHFDVRDGLGIAELVRAGLQVAWITGRGSEATERRARELGVQVLRTKAGPKARVLAEVQAELGVAPEATCSMGDDLPDLALFEGSGLRACPADAAPEVLAVADFRARRRGGRGAARDLAEAILRARGTWDDVVARHSGSRATEVTG